ncbi:MAG: arginine--tRNA ligase [Rhodospirillaceae bacterium]|nr:arginine--tRNA ligase [Rhodospirillaceae bacterium]|tara:strand:+ start:11479 stop:13251 length:1773 start_codon:yes stop_codon:yes gene_type:complete
MNVFNDFTSKVQVVIQDLQSSGALPEGGDLSRILAEPPRDPDHGDVATNAALVLSKAVGMKPRDVAERIAEKLQYDADVSSVDVAGPGFVNIRLATTFWHERLAELLTMGPAALLPDIGQGKTANVEYVSANPTGPLHVGHARGAVYGDALASVLAAVGYDVTREYYVNDAGSQVDTLAWSVYLRYLQAIGETVDDDAFEGFYPGGYLIPVAEKLAAERGNALKDAVGTVERGVSPLPEALVAVRDTTIEAMLDMIRDDLAQVGIRQEIFSSERAMVESGGIQACLAKLEGKGLIYTGVLEPPKGKAPEDWEPVPQTLFRSTDFGDDLDRPLKKSDGTWTYFAPDIAYHNAKVERGFDLLINVFGADHAGYVKRLKASVAALSDGKADFDILLTQLVNLFENGEPFRMSKRAGRFITLRDVVDAVGKDVVRFIMLTRRSDAPLDFDLVKVQEQSKDNPVFYVHYAHARICSVMRNTAEAGVDTGNLTGADLSGLIDEAEIGLIKTMARWPRVVQGAAEAHEPHRIATFLNDLAGEFHALWNKGRDDPSLRFLVEDNVDLTRARLALIDGVRQVMAAGLGLFGVEPKEEMR